MATTAANLIPISYLLVRTARIYWNGTVSAAMAERVQREEQQWYANEAGGDQRDFGYAKSVTQSASPTELENRVPRPGNRASVLSQPLSTVHTELSGPKTLGTAHRSILSAPSRAPPSYVTPSIISSEGAYNNIP